MRCLTLGSAATGAISLRNGKPGTQHWPRHSLTALCCRACSSDGWGAHAWHKPPGQGSTVLGWCRRVAGGVMLNLPGSPWVSPARSLPDDW